MNPRLTAVLLLVSLSGLAWSVSRRLLPLFAMQPDIRWDNPRQRIFDTFKYAFGQLRFLRRFERFHGLAHILIFWGALVVTINTIHIIGRGFVPAWHLPGFGPHGAGPAYAFVKDLFTLSVMIGCALAFYNRVLNRPARMILSAEALVILAWIFSMMAMDWLYESTRFILQPARPEQTAAFLGMLGRHMLLGMGFTASDPATAALHAAGFWGHLLLAFSFLNYLPYCKQFHELTAIPAVFMHSIKPRGALSRMDLESEEALYGVGRIEDFSWKRGLDLYTCAECGRCQAGCPAHLTEKPLSPMRLIMDEREHLKRKTPLMIRAALASCRQGPVPAREILEQWNGESLIGDVIAEETIWSCTTCGHCIANCPLLIEHVDNIIDLRRHLVQVESRFPRELRQAFKGFENLSNPWGLASNTRGDWFKDLGVKTPEENPEFEYLFYVGCAGSFDNQYRKAAIAITRIMQQAGINFACLGNGEMCCGETARRLGNEYLARHMISGNMEMFDTLGVKKIITACPHCFNTFKNEYPQFGRTYRVMHHTELIRDLAHRGVLKNARRFERTGPVVYHDSCYLGRYNNLFDVPREVARFIPGVDLVEAGRRERTGFCCGAGGGRMWMEEKTGKRINAERLDQLMQTGAKTVATACPYCLIMLDDAIKEKGVEEKIKVKDLSQMVWEAVEDA